jgi:hypothetical protein
MGLGSFDDRGCSTTLSRSQQALRGTLSERSARRRVGAGHAPIGRGSGAGETGLHSAAVGEALQDRLLLAWRAGWQRRPSALMPGRAQVT